mmetsp:Transcript_22188/g.21987  ORF Transcript_22188/g.21987 Transcript_22188/m.21987 type:complete len:89 (-) Transcript_22188:45-311(-)
MSRTALIWVFFLIYPGNGHEKFEYLELIGFILLIAGTLVYNEIVVIPFLGFNKNTKKAIAEREPKRESVDSYRKELLTNEENDEDSAI